MSKIIISLYVIVTSLALITIKLGSTKENIFGVFQKLPINVNFYTIVGILLYGVSFLLYIYLISKNELGFIIPLTTALVYILIFIASFLIFKEPFGTLKVLGIAFILCGLVLLNLNK